MNYLLAFIAGIATGAYLALPKLPAFHIPKAISVDPVIIGFAVIAVLTIANAMSKRGRK